MPTSPLPRPDAHAAPPTAAGASGQAAQLPPRPDWLRNRLAISGPADPITRFRAAAQGTNCIPWHLDLNAEEARLFAPMASAGPEASVLARELREAVAARHDRMLAGWAGPGACPLDLHRLIPVPPSILRLGEDDPAAQGWLRSHWGTQLALRQVRVLPGVDRRLRRSAKLTYEFYAADWSPWQALLRLRAGWPALVFDLRPDYGDG